MRNPIRAVFLALLLLRPAAAFAQEPGVPPAAQDTLHRQEPPRRPIDIRWYHIAGFVGLVGGSTLLDETVKAEIQDHRSLRRDDIARLARHVGQVEVYATVGLGTIATGLVLGEPRVTRAGLRISSGLLVAGAVVSGLKEVAGRKRPNRATDEYDFHPFSGNQSWPSGHATMAFALATASADEIHKVWITIPLYLAATATAWSRMNDNKHWLSDVVGGAVIGHTSARIMNGRYRIFGLRPPSFLLNPTNPEAVTVGWNLPLPH